MESTYNANIFCDNCGYACRIADIPFGELLDNYLKIAGCLNCGCLLKPEAINNIKQAKKNKKRKRK